MGLQELLGRLVVAAGALVAALALRFLAGHRCLPLVAGGPASPVPYRQPAGGRESSRVVPRGGGGAGGRPPLRRRHRSAPSEAPMTPMPMAALLVVLTAAFAAVNPHLLRPPTSLGLFALALVAPMVPMAVACVIPGPRGG